MGLHFSALLIGLSVMLLSLVVLFGLFALLNRFVLQRKAELVLDRLAEPALDRHDPGYRSAGAATLKDTAAARIEHVGRLFGDDKFKSSEEARLLRQAGVRAPAAVFVFFGLRLLLAAIGLVGALILGIAGIFGGASAWLIAAGAAIALYLIPKFVLESRARQRMRRFNSELPFFVDMLGLLQGVGLSLEQSLYSLGQGQDIGLPVVTQELQTISQQMSAGRTRIDAMQHTADQILDRDFIELVSILRQIDKYGGDVGATLSGFSQRLQEKQRMALREYIGKLTVKMTGVMVLTMLPALLMITAGPGFLAITRFFEHMTG